MTRNGVKPTPTERRQIQKILKRERPRTGLIIVNKFNETLFYRRPGNRRHPDGRPVDGCKLIWGLDEHAPRDS
jgi:hypothetical protein